MSSRPDHTRDPALVKKMASLLMQGATMLQETCPLDGLPLFRLRTGEVICPVHGRVLIVSSEREAREVEIDEILSDIEYEAALRLKEAARASDPKKLMEWASVIKLIEETLEVRKRRMQVKDIGAEADKGNTGRK